MAFNGIRIGFALIFILSLSSVADTSIDTRLPWERTKDQEWAQKDQESFEVPKDIPPNTTYFSLPGHGKVLAMTFDDGPHRTLTPKLLDMLKERNIKATFYVVGQNVKYYPEITRRIVEEGHEIGNHTWAHPNLNRIPEASMRREMQITHDIIVQATGVAPRTMRPPGGNLTEERRQFMYDNFDYTSIYWSCDPKDWQRPGVRVVIDRLVAGASDGAILLAHDIHEPTIQAMPETLDRILEKGYRFLTVSQLLALDSNEAHEALIELKRIKTAQNDPVAP